MHLKTENRSNNTVGEVKRFCQLFAIGGTLVALSWISESGLASGLPEMQQEQNDSSTKSGSVTQLKESEFLGIEELGIENKRIEIDMDRVSNPKDKRSVTTLDRKQVASPTKALLVDGAILKTIKSTNLAAQVSGTIQQLNVKEGTRVEEGQTIGKVRDLAIHIQNQKAKEQLAIAKRKRGSDIDKRLAEKHQDVAKNEHLRALEANSKVAGVYPKNEVDRLKLVFDRTTLELERAEYQQELLQHDIALAELEIQQNEELIQRHTINSPTKGVIVSVDKKPGEWVDPGDLIVSIVEIDPLRIEGFLKASDVTKNLAGAKATLTVDIGGKKIVRGAVLTFISPEVNPLNSNVRVYLEVENGDGKLRPGLRPEVIIGN